jgi:hypothetical protein
MGRKQAYRGHRQQMVEAAQGMEEPGQEAGITAVPGMGECDARCEQQGDCHKQTKCRSGHGSLLRNLPLRLRRRPARLHFFVFYDFRRMVVNRTFPRSFEFLGSNSLAGVDLDQH